MSIASELATLAASKASIKAAISAKNPATAPTDELSQWPTAIASIPKPPTLVETRVTPTAAGYTSSPPSGQAYIRVEVAGDADLVPANVRSGVQVFDVMGTLQPAKEEQSKTVTPTAAGLTVTPDSGKVLNQVTVNGDADLVPGNIKKDVNIFGVTGTYEASGGGGLTGHTVTLVADENAYSVAIVYADGTAASNVGVAQDEVRTVQNVLAVVTRNADSVTAHVVADGDRFNVYAPCLLEDTLVLLADGSVKPVESIAYSDTLAVWDFDEGHMSSARPLWIKVPQESGYFWRSTFRSGRTLETMGHSGHRVFSLDSNRFEYVTECVGHRVALADGSEDVLEETVRVWEPCRYYNIITEGHINLYAGDVLTGCSLENGLYPVRDMKFVKDGRRFRPFSEFEGAVSRAWYDGCRYGESSLDLGYLVKYHRDRLPLAMAGK